MKHKSLGRLGFAAAVLACLFAAFSASALGAGKPQITAAYQNWGVGTLGTGPNHQQLVAVVNPNGAATTVTIKFREYGSTGAWKTVLSKEVGSGAETVEMSAQAFPLLMGKRYEGLVTATNSYGSSTSGFGLFGIKWRVFGSGEGSATSSYTAPGTFKSEWEPLSGYHGKLECGQEASGEFGPKAKSESLKLTMSNCSYYINNSLWCKPKAFSLNLNNVFQAEEVSLKLCPEDEYLTPIRFSEAFLVYVGMPEDYAIVRPATMTASGTVLGHPATMISTSNWQLSGANVGKKFGMFES